MSPTSLALQPTPNERLAATIAHGGTAVAWFLCAPHRIPCPSAGFPVGALPRAAVASLVALGHPRQRLLTCGLAIPIFLGWHIVAAFKTLNSGGYSYPLVGEAAQRAVYDEA